MILRTDGSHPVHQRPSNSAWSHRPNGLLPLSEGLGILVIQLRMDWLVPCQTPASVSLGIYERNIHGVYTLEPKNRRGEKLDQHICFCILPDDVAFYRLIVTVILRLVGLRHLI